MVFFCTTCFNGNSVLHFIPQSSVSIPEVVANTPAVQTSASDSLSSRSIVAVTSWKEAPGPCFHCCLPFQGSLETPLEARRKNAIARLRNWDPNIQFRLSISPYDAYKYDPLPDEHLSLFTNHLPKDIATIIFNYHSIERTPIEANDLGRDYYDWQLQQFLNKVIKEDSDFAEKNIFLLWKIKVLSSRAKNILNQKPHEESLPKEKKYSYFINSMLFIFQRAVSIPPANRNLILETHAAKAELLLQDLSGVAPLDRLRHQISSYGLLFENPKPILSDDLFNYMVYFICDYDIQMKFDLLQSFVEYYGLNQSEIVDGVKVSDWLTAAFDPAQFAKDHRITAITLNAAQVIFEGAGIIKRI